MSNTTQQRVKGQQSKPADEKFFSLRKRIRDAIVAVFILDVVYIVFYSTGFFNNVYEYLIGSPPKIVSYLVLALVCLNASCIYALKYLDR